MKGSPYVTGSSPTNVIVDPNGKYAYIVDYASSAVSAYSVNATTGALTAVKGSPFAAGTDPEYVAVDPAGKFAYVPNVGSTNISAYTIQSTGALKPVKGSPFTGARSPRRSQSVVSRRANAFRRLCSDAVATATVTGAGPDGWGARDTGLSSARS